MNGLQAGVATIGICPGSHEFPTFSVSFTQEYTTTTNLIVLATPLQGSNYQPNILDCFAVTVTSVTSTGFTVNVVRVDTAEGWYQNLQLAWMAFYTTGN